MNLLAIVSAQLLLLFLAPRPHWLLDIAVCILAADHEADLAAWIGRNGSVCVLGDGEDFFAGLLKAGDEIEVKPLVLGYAR